MLVEVGGNWEAWLRGQKEEQVKLVEQLKQEVSVTSEKLKKLKTNSRGRRVNCRR